MLSIRMAFFSAFPRLRVSNGLVGEHGAAKRTAARTLVEATDYPATTGSLKVAAIVRSLAQLEADELTFFAAEGSDRTRDAIL